MARYRKRPVVVEAEQWFPGKEVPGVHWVCDYLQEDADGKTQVCHQAYVVTIHGERARIAPGDWVITEPDGIHHYPCKDVVFQATYEPVN